MRREDTAKDLLSYRDGPQFGEAKVATKVSRVDQRARTPAVGRNFELRCAEYRILKLG